MGMKKNHPLNRLKDMREASGFTQEALAKEMGILKNAISRKENGSNPLTTQDMHKISQILKCKPYEIMVDPNEVVNDVSGELAKHFDLLHGYTNIDEHSRHVIDGIIKLGLENVNKNKSSKTRAGNQKKA